MNYLLIATVVIYIGIARLFETAKLNLFLAAFLVVALPETLRLLLLFIQIPDVSPLIQLGVGGVIKLLFQFMVMVVTFMVLRRNEERIFGWWLYLLLGMIVSVIVVPYMTAGISL